MTTGELYNTLNDAANFLVDDVKIREKALRNLNTHMKFQLLDLDVSLNNLFNLNVEEALPAFPAPKQERVKELIDNIKNVLGDETSLDDISRTGFYLLLDLYEVLAYMSNKTMRDTNEIWYKYYLISYSLVPESYKKLNEMLDQFLNKISFIPYKEMKLVSRDPQLKSKLEEAATKYELFAFGFEKKKACIRSYAPESQFFFSRRRATSDMYLQELVMSSYYDSLDLVYKYFLPDLYLKPERYLSYVDFLGHLSRMDPTGRLDILGHLIGIDKYFMDQIFIPIEKDLRAYVVKFEGFSREIRELVLQLDSYDDILRLTETGSLLDVTILGVDTNWIRLKGNLGVFNNATGKVEPLAIWGEVKVVLEGDLMFIKDSSKLNFSVSGPEYDLEDVKVKLMSKLNAAYDGELLSNKRNFLSSKK